MKIKFMTVVHFVTYYHVDSDTVQHHLQTGELSISMFTNLRRVSDTSLSNDPYPTFLFIPVFDVTVPFC